MSISHVADAVTAHDTATAGSISVTGPSGFASGHVAVLWVELLGTATLSGLTTAGWVQQVIENSNTNLQVIGFTGKFSDVGAGPWSVSQSAGSKCRFVVSAYAGVDQTNVLDGTPTHSQVNSASTASISVTSALAASWLSYDALGIHAFGSAQTATTSDGSDTVVDVHGSSSASGSDFVGLVGDSRRDLTAGTQTRTVTFSSGSQTHVAQAAMMLRAAVTAVAPSGIAVGAALGGPSLADGSLSVAPSGIAKTTALGALAVADGSMAIAPAGKALSASLGALSVVDGSLAAAPAGKSLTAALGTLSISDGSMSVAPSGIATAVGLGSPSLGQSQALALAGIGIIVGLGGTTVSGDMAVGLAGIAALTSLGDLSLGASFAVIPDGIGTTVGLGSPTTANVSKIVTRPDVGLVERPNSGLVDRPSTGIITRP